MLELVWVFRLSSCEDCTRYESLCCNGYWTLQLIPEDSHFMALYLVMSEPLFRRWTLCSLNVAPTILSSKWGTARSLLTEPPATQNAYHHEVDTRCKVINSNLVARTIDESRDDARHTSTTVHAYICCPRRASSCDTLQLTNSFY